MKAIYITTTILFLAMITMAIFYFSKVNEDKMNNDTSLYAATYNSGIIFCVQNDKSVFEILKSQDLFHSLIGEKKFKAFATLKNELLLEPEINRLFNQQNIYISFLPGNDKKVDFLISTQLNSKEDQSAVPGILSAKNIKVENINNLIKLTFTDSSTFYLGIANNLILISNAPEHIVNTLNSLKEKKQNEFAAYIQSGHALKKNSLANLFINFNQLPDLLKTVTTGISGELAIFNRQNSFASLSYNFSQEKLLFNGNTAINDPDSYYNLFSRLKPQKITIDNILPKNTANYTVYTLEDYVSWQKTLNKWFSKQRNNQQNKVIQNINLKYHLNLEEAFPKYTKNQFITFQLKTREKLGAINLTNGDKLAQQLLDISEPYNDGRIRLFKEADLLYCYFGAPFKKFKRPYYAIIDNHMIFSNNASTVQDVLDNYKNNNLLINTDPYSNTYNQLSATSTLTFYVNNDQSVDIFRDNLLMDYYRQYRSKDGLRQFDTFTLQLSGDNGKFQTNLLFNKRADTTKKDTLSNKSPF